MRRCFIMQPFDNGPFDKRYESAFAPAIESAGVVPYRVDRDPADGIRDSELCFADIATDNPNVWFELGFALAIPREVVLACSDERKSKYPFDVQHRSIITYKTGAPQDFDELKQKITKRVQAVLKKNEELGRVVTRSTIVKDTEVLNQHELVALASVMQNAFLSNGYVAVYQIRNDMNTAGFTDLAVSLALKTLAIKGMITTDLWPDDRDGESYAGVMKIALIARKIFLREMLRPKNLHGEFGRVRSIYPDFRLELGYAYNFNLSWTGDFRSVLGVRAPVAAEAWIAQAFAAKGNRRRLDMDRRPYRAARQRKMLGGPRYPAEKPAEGGTSLQARGPRADRSDTREEIQRGNRLRAA